MFGKLFGKKSEYKKLEKIVNNSPIISQTAPPDDVLKAITNQTSIMDLIHKAHGASKITTAEAEQLKRTLIAKMPQYVMDLAQTIGAKGN